MGDNRAGKHDDDIRRLNAQGMTCPQIARALGMTRDGVRFAHHRLGIAIHRAIAPGDRHDAQIRQMREAGMSGRQIAEELGMDRTSVYDRWHAMDEADGIHREKYTDEVTLKPFAELSIYHQRTLRRLLPAWFGEEMR